MGPRCVWKPVGEPPVAAALDVIAILVVLLVVVTPAWAFEDGSSCDEDTRTRVCGSGRGLGKHWITSLT